MNSKTAAHTSGYPLIALFLVITACGIVAALIAPMARAVTAGQVGPRDAITSALAGTLFVAILGAIVGLFHYRRGRGVTWGVITGAIIGLLVGPMVLVPRESFGAVVSLSFGGAVVILLVSVAFRLAARK